MLKSSLKKCSLWLRQLSLLHGKKLGMSIVTHYYLTDFGCFYITFKPLLYSINFKSYKAFCNLDSKKNQYIFINKKANEGNTHVISNWLIFKQLQNGLQRPPEMMLLRNLESFPLVLPPIYCPYLMEVYKFWCSRVKFLQGHSHNGVIM